MKYFLFLFLSVFAFVPSFLCGQDVTAEKNSSGTIVIKRMPEKHYKLIPLNTMDFQTVENLCRPMMSEGAVLTYEKHRNAILVYDTKEVIDKITKLLADTDQEAVNIRIDIDFMNSGGGGGTEIRIDRNYGGKGGKNPQPLIVMKDGKVQKPQEIKIKKFGVTNDRSSDNTSQFLMTKSGFPASLWVGKTIVDPSWLENLKYMLRPTIIAQSGGGVFVAPGTTPDFKWANVGASMKVLPVYKDNGTIDVEIYPEVSYIDGKGKNKAVKVEQLATKVNVADGQRIYIGGVISSKREEYINVFGPEFFKSSSRGNALDMYLTATALKPSGKKVKSPAGSTDYVDPMRVFRR